MFIYKIKNVHTRLERTLNLMSDMFENNYLWHVHIL